ncbi:MAG: hypothetical protein QM496_20790 [Verrucomicrobiota bacterium]
MSEPNQSAPPSRKVYFLHIPKTSGSAFGGWLRRLYTAENSIPCYDLVGLLELPLEEINSYSCYSGHFGASLLDILDSPVATVTYLRKPIERILSLAQHILREPAVEQHPGWKDHYQNILTSAHPVEAMLDVPAFIEAIQNAQAQELTVRRPLLQLLTKGKPDSQQIQELMKQSSIPPQHLMLENAITFLDRMPTFGIFEQSVESVNHIANCLNLPGERTLLLERVAPQRKNVITPDFWSSSIHLGLRRKLENFVEIDQQLYDYAVDRFNSEKLQNTGFSFPTEAQSTK